MLRHLTCKPTITRRFQVSHSQSAWWDGKVSPPKDECLLFHCCMRLWKERLTISPPSPTCYSLEKRVHMVIWCWLVLTLEFIDNYNLDNCYFAIKEKKRKRLRFVEMKWHIYNIQVSNITCFIVYWPSWNIPKTICRLTKWKNYFTHINPR